MDNNGTNTVNDATVTANANIPDLTTNFTDITNEPFTREILCENFYWHFCVNSTRLLQAIIQTRNI